MDKKILIEELNRIKYISNYNLSHTSEENKKIILERNALRDFLSTARGSEVVRGEVESILKAGGIELKTAKSALGGERTLFKASEVLKAVREGKLASESLAELKGVMMKNTKDRELMNAIAHDIVYSERFIENYSHLSHSEIKDMLATKSSMKLPRESEQTRAILNAHDAKLAEDARNAGRKPPVEDDFFRDTESFREPKPYNSEKEWKTYEGMNQRERVTEFKRRYPKSQVARDAKSAPKKLFESLKKAGLLVWKAGGWVISNVLWILIFGGLAYAVWANWSKITGVFKDCGEGMVEDPETGDCVKAGSSTDNGNGSGSDDNKITDSEGNTYDPCSGVYKIGCVTSDGIKENGVDNISKAQECLGLSPTGKFNKELENKLYSKINKRSFNHADLSLICLPGGTLAAL